MNYEDHPGTKCPRCDSPSPHLHPAVQCGGEVQPCTDPYHSIRTPENARYVDNPILLGLKNPSSNDGGKK